jgi:hypothetical protein
MIPAKTSRFFVHCLGRSAASHTDGRVVTAVVATTKG